MSGLLQSHGLTVYFLTNTCLTGLRSSGIISREVSVFIIIGLTARRGGEGRGKGRWRANTCDLQRPLAVVDAIVSTDDVNNIVGYRAVR